MIAFLLFPPFLKVTQLGPLYWVSILQPSLPYSLLPGRLGQYALLFYFVWLDCQFNCILLREPELDWPSCATMELLIPWNCEMKVLSYYFEKKWFINLEYLIVSSYLSLNLILSNIITKNILSNKYKNINKYSWLNYFSSL